MLGKTNVPGFLLVQVVLAIAIVALALAVAIPGLTARMPLYEQREFVSKLNAFMAEAWQQGLTSQKTQKVLFDMDRRQVLLEQETHDLDAANGEPLYKPVPLQYTPTLTWPETLEFRQFFIQGVDELASSSHRTTHGLWIYVLPEGMAQEVIINVVNTKNPPPNEEGRKFSLVLNPITVQFKTYDEFQNPS